MKQLKELLEIMKYVFFAACCIGVFIFTIRAFMFTSSYLFGEIPSMPLITITTEG